MQHALNEAVYFPGKHGAECAKEFFLEIRDRDERDQREQHDDGREEGDKDPESNGCRPVHEVAHEEGMKEEPRDMIDAEATEARKHDLLQPSDHPAGGSRVKD